MIERSADSGLQTGTGMKFNRITALIVAIAMSISGMGLTACSRSTEDDSGDKLRIVTTIFAAYDFARQIGGESAAVSMLLKPGSEAHTFEPTPGDIINIGKCDIFVCAGGENDAWVDRMLESIDNPGMTVIRMTECVDNILTEEIIEGMQSDEADGAEALGTHADEEWDEHVWMDPDNAIMICRKIAQTCKEKDTAGAAGYDERLDAYSKQLADLDGAISEAVGKAASATVVFADRFPARYFTEKYGLKYYAAFPGCSENTEASPATVSFLIDKVQEDKIPAVFITELSNGNLAQVVSEATGAKVLTFYACHNVSADDFENGVTYIEMMERNLAALQTALQR